MMNFWKACCSANGVRVLLHDVGSVIPAILMFMGVSPTSHRYELIVWRTIYSTTIYVQQGHFDALMTIDLGVVCWAVGLLVAIKFFYLQA